MKKTRKQTFYLKEVLSVGFQAINSENRGTNILGFSCEQ